MGLIYSKGDSQGLMDSLSDNIQAGTKFMDDLKRACRNLADAVDGRLLSGTAYEAGKGLFEELIIPTIDHTTKAIDEVQSKLSAYRQADANVSEDYLDEDNLNEQIDAQERLIDYCRDMAYRYRMCASLTLHASVAELYDEYADRMDEQADMHQEAKDELKGKLRQLHDFSYAVNGLFYDSLDSLAIAMQGVTSLNQTSINISTGAYELPSTVSQSWLKETFKVNMSGLGYKLFADGSLWVDSKGQLHADGSAEAKAYLLNLKTQGEFEIAGVKFNEEGCAYVGAEAAGKIKSSFGKDGIEISAKAKVLLGTKGSVQGGFAVDKGILSLKGDAKGEAIAGAWADASGKIYINKYGISAYGKASAKAGTEATAKGQISEGKGPFKVGLSGSGKAFAGAKASAGANASLSLKDIGFDVEADTLAGAEAEVHGAVTTGYTTVDLGVGVATGVGEDVKTKVSIKDGHLKVEGALGASLGVGADFKVNIDIDYGQAIDDLDNFVSWVKKAV